MIKSDEMKELLSVASFGGCGGIGSLVYSFTIGTKPAVDVFPFGIPAYFLLGAISALIGVYVIAKTDTRLVTHCLAFAMVCGLSWAPIIDGSRALVSQQKEKQRLQETLLVNEEIRKTVNTINTADNSKLPEIKDKLISYTAKLADISEQASTIKTMHEAKQGLISVNYGIKELTKKNSELGKDIQKEVGIFGRAVKGGARSWVWIYPKNLDDKSVLSSDGFNDIEPDVIWSTHVLDMTSRTEDFCNKILSKKKHDDKLKK